MSLTQQVLAEAQAQAEEEGGSARSVLEAYANAPDEQFSNRDVGRKCIAIGLLQRMDKKAAKEAAGEDTDTYTADDIDDLSAQLRRHLQPPLYVGATPATPFRIETQVDNEIAEHMDDYAGCESFARDLLLQWIREHPTHHISSSIRDMIARAAMQAVEERDQFMENLREKSRREHMIRLKKRAAHSSTAALSAAAEAKEDSASVSSSTLLAVGGLGLGDSPAVNTNDELVEQLVESHGMGEDDAPSRRLQEMEHRMAAQQAHMQQQQQAFQQQMAAMQQAFQQQMAQQPAAQQQPAVRAPSVMIGASALPHPPAPLHGASPAATVNVTYGQAKAYLTNKFQSTMIDPMQQEIARLNAVLRYYQGEPDMNDPKVQDEARAAQERFRKPGGKKLFERRADKFKVLKASLERREADVAVLLPEIANLRLNCRLYYEQVEKDKLLLNETEDEKRERTDRWKEDNDRREQAKRDRLQRDQNRLNRQVVAPAPASYGGMFQPAAAPVFGVTRSAPAPRAAASAVMEDDVEESDDDADV